MTSFVILGTQRTGTTLLTTTLNRHASIRCYGESFKAFRPRGKVDVDDSGYLDWRRRSPLRTFRHWMRRRESIAMFLDELYESGAADQQAVGFKLMLNQSARDPFIVEYLLDHDIRGIDLYRENVLATLISRLTAQQTRVFHSTENVKAPAVVVPTHDLLRRLAVLAAETTAWSEQLAGRMPMHRLSYEVLARDLEGAMSGILQFLGVPGATTQSKLRKIGSADLRERIANYADVETKLRRTEFARYLTGGEAMG